MVGVRDKEKLVLNFTAHWEQPVQLVDGAKHGLIYYVDDIEGLPTSPGAYVFARVHGDNAYPLYVGETTNIRSRLKSHFKSSVKLMTSIKGAPTGKRIFLYCTIKTSSEKKRDAMIVLLQRAIIEHALSEGHELFNKQGTKIKAHTISFTGNRTSEQITPRTMYVEP
jgi:hypothetical protein